MKIKILKDPPINKVHGITKDRVFEVLKYQPHIHGVRGSSHIWIMGDTDEKVKLWPHEFEVLNE